MSYTIINRDDLPRAGGTWEFEGVQYDSSDVSFIWVDMPPGERVRLHSHPYPEIFIVLEGRPTYTVGTDTLEAHAGQIIIVPADVPHAFVNSGTSQLRQIDIHVSKEYLTDWLED